MEFFKNIFHEHEENRKKYAPSNALEINDKGRYIYIYAHINVYIYINIFIPRSK